MSQPSRLARLLDTDATLVCVAALAACARAPAEPVERPAPRPEPPAEVEVRLVEDCRLWTAGEARPALAVSSENRTRAAALAARGEADVALGLAARDPVARVQYVASGYASLEGSLARDPYGARAALSLALVQQVVERPRCARNLVERIVALEAHATLGATARSEVAAALAAMAELRATGRYEAVLAPIERGALDEVAFGPELDGRGRTTWSPGCAWFAPAGSDATTVPPAPPTGSPFRPVPPPEIPCPQPLPVLP